MKNKSIIMGLCIVAVLCGMFLIASSWYKLELRLDKASTDTYTLPPEAEYITIYDVLNSFFIGVGVFFIIFGVIAFIAVVVD